VRKRSNIRRNSARRCSNASVGRDGEGTAISARTVRINSRPPCILALSPRLPALHGASSIFGCSSFEFRLLSSFAFLTTRARCELDLANVAKENFIPGLLTQRRDSTRRDDPAFPVSRLYILIFIIKNSKLTAESRRRRVLRREDRLCARRPRLRASNKHRAVIPLSSLPLPPPRKSFVR